VRASSRSFPTVPILGHARPRLHGGHAPPAPAARTEGAGVEIACGRPSRDLRVFSAKVVALWALPSIQELMAAQIVDELLVTEEVI